MLSLLLPLIPVTFVFFLFGVKFWRTTIVWVFAWLLLEGAARKWLLPQYQAPILILKDIALLAAYCGYLLSPKARVPHEDNLSTIKILCGVFAVYCAAEMMNPNLPNAAVGLYGLKNYLMYIPLMFILPEMYRSRDDVNKLLFWAVLTAIPICLLALYQFTQPPTSWINHYVSHDADAEAVASMFGEHEEGEFKYGRARVASTFSYLSGLTTYLLLVVPLLGALLLSANRGTRTKLAAIAIVLAIGATFTTGSRSTILIIAVITPLMIIIGGFKGILARDIALRLSAVSVLFALAIIFVFGNAAEALIYRAQTTSDTSSRFMAPFIDTLGAYTNTPLFGMGVGSNSNAAAQLGSTDLYWLNGDFHEVESARIMQDLGLAGFALFYWIKFYTLFLVAKYLVWSRSKLFVTLHLAVLMFLIPHLVLFTVNNPTGGLINWALLGLSVAIHRIERGERRGFTAPSATPPKSEPPPLIAQA